MNPRKEDDQRREDTARITATYRAIEAAMSEAGRLLRTTAAGKYGWANDHKMVISGLRIAVEHMRRDIPKYDGSD